MNSFLTTLSDADLLTFHAQCVGEQNARTGIPSEVRNTYEMRVLAVCIEEAQTLLTHRHLSPLPPIIPRGFIGDEIEEMIQMYTQMRKK